MSGIACAIKEERVKEEEEEGEEEEEEGEYLFCSEAGQMRGGYLFGSGVELILDCAFLKVEFVSVFVLAWNSLDIGTIFPREHGF